MIFHPAYLKTQLLSFPLHFYTSWTFDIGQVYFLRTGKLLKFYHFTKMVPPTNLEITAQYQFYRNFQGCWEDRTQSVG